MSIHETFGAVVILVPTVCSVHKMVFPHPNRIMKQQDHLMPAKGQRSGSRVENGLPSIFAEAGPRQAKENSHVIQNSGTSKSENLSVSHLPVYGSLI